MSLQVEKLEKNMAKLTIEVSPEELEGALQRAYLKNRKQISIPNQPALRVDLQRAKEQRGVCGGGHRGEICDRSKGRHGVCKDGVLAVTE